MECKAVQVQLDRPVKLMLQFYKFEKSFYLWLSDGSLEMGELAVSIGGSAASLLQCTASCQSASIAKQLAARMQVPCFVSCNLQLVGDSQMGLVMEKIVEALS
jgi:hypothetical protein